MEYRIATKEDTIDIYELVQKTIKEIYPKYYLPEIVDMFSNYHNMENVTKDIELGNTYVLLEGGSLVGTGTIQKNHITRVYVLPQYQGKGYGTSIMKRLESELAGKYKLAEIDASLPACQLYYKLGYRTTQHGSWECENGVVQIYEIMTKELKSNPSQLRLRPYKTCDAKEIVSWIHTEEDLYKWSSDRFGAFPISEDDINTKYIDNNGDCPDPEDFYPVTALDDNGVVGHLILRYTDKEKKILRFGFVIVDDAIRGKGYGKEMLKLAMKYAYDILKVEKITLGVFENNPAAYHCYKAAGFEDASEIMLDVYGNQWKCIEMESNKKKYNI